MKQIYGLYDPSAVEIGAPCIRYVGFTGFSLDRRVIGHVSDATTGHANHRCNWIRSLLSRGVRPAAMTIEEVSDENWKERERYWIATLPRLTNSVEGGEGLVNPSEDVRRRISEKVSEGLKGNSRRAGISHSNEHRQKISDGLRNSESRKAYTESLKGIVPIAATEAARRFNTGRKYSEDHCRNMGIAHIGNKSRTGQSLTAEHRAKIAAAQIGNTKALGYKHTDEAKSRIAMKARRRWITNGVETRKLNFDEALPEGWRFGMK